MGVIDYGRSACCDTFQHACELAIENIFRRELKRL
jgi:hypothetical protein